MHADCPELAEYIPAPQEVQTDDIIAVEKGLYFPASHCEQEDRPVESEYLPAGQDPHADWPEELAAVPLGQATHVDMPAAE